MPDEHQTNCRLACRLPACCHDALKRLVRVTDWSAEALIDRLITPGRVKERWQLALRHTNST